MYHHDSQCVKMFLKHSYNVYIFFFCFTSIYVSKCVFVHFEQCMHCPKCSRSLCPRYTEEWKYNDAAAVRSLSELEMFILSDLKKKNSLICCARNWGLWGCLIKDPPWASQCLSEGFQEGPQLGPCDAERRHTLGIATRLSDRCCFSSWCLYILWPHK